MADRYQTLVGTSVGKFLVKNLGLPNPTPLQRYRDGDPLIAGPVLVGGKGPLADAAANAIKFLGGEALNKLDDKARVKGLVFDASGLTSSEQLIGLPEFFTPVLRQLLPCSRVVVLGRPPEQATTTEERIAQRALEGFTRSLAKEVGRGGTIQLVYVEAGAEDRLESTLGFLLSAKSAYVSGQVVRVSNVVADPDTSAGDPSHPLIGRVALVTGAARGIGEAIARTLHRDGATIVGVDVPQSASELQALMTELGGSNITLDITAVDAPQRIARAISEQYGGVDVVVHNAGITRDKKLANMDTDRWNSLISVNLTAPQRITAELLKQQLIKPNGRVIGVASIAGIAGNVGQTNYAASKAGVIGFVDAMAPQVAGQGITVNAVAPGFIETQMTAQVPLMIREAGRWMNSMSQGGLPEDVAETIAWFANPASYGVTGNVVRVCGQSLLGA